MAVSKIEEYRQKDGEDILKVILKPTKKFPNGGYFYTDSEAIDLVKSHAWYFNQRKSTSYIEAHNWRSHISFHRELANLYLSYYPDYIDHVSLVEIDNTNQNLNVVTNQQNNFNKFTKGYVYQIKLNNRVSFSPCLKYNQEVSFPFGVAYTELEACQLQHELETSYLKDLMDNQYYMYDFLKDRRNDLDILDLERTGVISQDEATYYHVLKYADNAW